jgi:hypothetical protein
LTRLAIIHDPASINQQVETIAFVMEELSYLVLSNLSYIMSICLAALFQCLVGMPEPPLPALIGIAGYVRAAWRSQRSRDFDKSLHPTSKCWGNVMATIAPSNMSVPPGLHLLPSTKQSYGRQRARLIGIVDYNGSFRPAQPYIAAVNNVDCL